MGRFQIWGRVTHTGPGEFLVVVTGMPEDSGASPHVFTQASPSRDAALVMRDVLMNRMGREVRQLGGEISDAVEDS